VNCSPFTSVKYLLNASLFLNASILVWLPFTVLAESGKPTSPRDIAEQELISKRDQLTRERATIIGNTENTGGVVEPPQVIEAEDLISKSAILCLGGNLTLIPKKSVIYVPKQFAGRLTPTDYANVLTWVDFFPLNRGWISTMEVTMAQAEGKEPLTAADLDKITKSGNVVVATLDGNPITVLPPKEVKIPPVTPKQSPPSK
jgi:hypothetical protein